MQIPIKKNIVPIIIGSLCILFLGSKLYFSPLNTWRDVLFVSRDYREPAHFIYDRAKLPPVGSTESDVYAALSKNIDRRLTFKEVREKTSNGQTFQYNKIIEYTDEVYVFEQHMSASNTQVSSAYPKDDADVIIFLLDGKVTFVSARYQTRAHETDDMVTNEDVSLNLDEKGKAWPGAQDDLNTYMLENGIKPIVF